MASKVGAITAQNMMDVARHMPFVNSAIGDRANPQGRIYGQETVSNGQACVELFPIEKRHYSADVAEMKTSTEDGVEYFAPEGRMEVAKVVYVSEIGRKGVITLLTRRYGPLAAAAAFEKKKIPMSDSEIAFKISDYEELKEGAAEAADVITQLYQDLVRHQLGQAFRERHGVDSPRPARKFERYAEEGMEALCLTEEDRRTENLWVINRSESRLDPFSTMALSNKLKDTAFAFESFNAGWIFAQEVRATLEERASRLEEGQKEHLVTTKQIWDAVVETSLKQQRKPKDPEFFAEMPDAERFSGPLYALDRVDDYPLDLLVELIRREAALPV
ncbi:MAG: hypothetical protein S4CHLAM37_00590 [Chlamydiia bacterium]|nr:hypothetical protein [Chlamydiia bacterium]